MKFTTLRQVLDYIENKTNFQLGILRVEKFLKQANIPFENLNYIHVGGTNGKGSVSYYLSNILIESGYKVGMFSSPSIEKHNDRIRINNEFIPDEAIIDFVNEYYEIIEQTEVTMFEIDVLMALDYFAKNKVEYVVMEVGMGGRFDGTNVIMPLFSIITNIGVDHQTYLGNDKLEIAYNKAGIIKKDNLVITGEKDKECLKVIEDYALKMNAKVIETNIPEIISLRPIIFNYNNYNNVELKTLADYQIKNSMIVLEAVNVLKNKYQMPIKDEVIKDVFKKKTWNGRFEIMSANPLIIIDGAHNVEGVKELTSSIMKFSEYKKTIMFAALEDKATDEMVSMLIDTNSEVVISEFDFYRTKKAIDINKNFNLEIALNYQEYLNEKIVKMKSDEMLIITGSLYFISEIRKFLINTLNLDEKVL
ncbi:dihydrofolate synthase/folylpolyglutamate synthase [Bacilli bacterium PM5-3]|nr:dihydrofolate synthase/folylpolyglutamate synthase [Bacilli bacterium PM5-3]